MAGIDLHTHLAPELGEAEIAELPGVSADHGRLAVDGSHGGPPRLNQPEALEAWLDERSLDAAAVSPPPPFFRQHLLVTEAGRWVRALNDGMRRAVAGRPRLLPMAYLPLEHPKLALAELDHLLTQDGWAGFAASAGGRSTSLADPSLEPLWQRLSADGRPVMLHPGSSPDARLGEFYLANLLGNPYETAVAVAQLLFGEVTTRHPGLRFLLVHCGGCVPAVLGRWQRGVDTNRPDVPALATPLRQAIRSFYIDCLAHDPDVVDLAVRVFGADRMVLGSDWPFPMGSDDPVTLLSHRDAGFVRQVGEENARTLLGTFT
ncbi:amidohydrolase family protein [Acrocarpospora macrocephala]|uniref:2-hydroxy-3-carboxy-6-oxo-7-methylocta-2,4-dienoa te decarboxylase n=1 Tax=Acrocarpospora macrocephala TaxID=150177 RepID=A0A5M3WTQ3_9ACTN|nr:amidohydrolase family protein [Acrocarpospora macrocephala]GES12274.1 2-hydroxy-3-carboxy-6-oxo-7-methylocta-2,4-dienoa te decarboxylase [Acrocarpospora macrocephala]